MSKKQDTAIEEAPGLGDAKALFPPTLDAVPVLANVSMTRRCGSLVCSSKRSVRDPERNSEQDEVLPRGSYSAARGSLTDPRTDPRPSCRRPLECSQ